MTVKINSVQQMVERIPVMLPNVFAALVIGIMGWFVLRTVRSNLSRLPSAAGFNRIGTEIGSTSEIQASELAAPSRCSMFVPALSASFNAPKPEAISVPVTHLLSVLLATVPKIIAAIIISTLAYWLKPISCSVNS